MIYIYDKIGKQSSKYNNTTIPLVIEYHVYKTDALGGYLPEKEKDRHKMYVACGSWDYFDRWTTCNEFKTKQL